MSQEPKAKDILNELTKRKTLLERMTERMLPRAFERISVASSARLFDYFDVPDPYSPILIKRKKWKSEIGTSALILGENRREVAPHSKVPDLKPKKSDVQKSPQQFRPQGIPSAPRREEKRPPPPPQSNNEFGGGHKHGLVGKLPMRPDMKAPDPNSSPVKSVAQPVTKPSSSPASRPTARPSPVPLRQFASPKGRGKLNRGLPPSGTSARPSPEELASRRPPVTSSQQKQARTDSLRMKRTKITKKSPVIRDISKPVEAQTEIPKPPKTEMPPVEHSPQHRPTNSMDLDDLFGFGGQDEGRVKMPKRTKKKR